jgi:hypothetical protein
MLTPVLIPIILFVTTAVVINNALKYRFQRRIIDSGLIDASIVKALLKPADVSHEALKWGLLFLFGGVGLVVVEFLPYQAGRSLLPYGVEAIFLSIGFLIYYLLVRREQSHP